MDKHEMIYDDFVNSKAFQSRISIMEIDRLNTFWNSEHNYVAKRISEQCDEGTCHAILNHLAFEYFIGFMQGSQEGYKEGLYE